MTEQTTTLFVTFGIYVLALLYDRVRHAGAPPEIERAHEHNRVGIFRYQRRHLQ